MGLFDRHIDRLLADFSAGDLSPARTRRMMDHAKGCERCGARLNQVLAAQRVLQGSLFKPSEQEQAAWSASAAAVVAASAGQPERSSQRAWFLAFAAAAAACLALFVLWPRASLVARDDEFAVRGDGKNAPVTLRLYCAAAAGELIELAEGGSCKVGSSLGFAAGAAAPLEHVRLKVVENGSTVVDATLAVPGKPGAEEALAVSLKLNHAGTVQVEATFAEKKEALDSAQVRVAREVAVEAR